MLKLRDIQDPEIIYFDPVLRYRERENQKPNGKQFGVLLQTRARRNLTCKKPKKARTHYSLGSLLKT